MLRDYLRKRMIEVLEDVEVTLHLPDPDVPHSLGFMIETELQVFKMENEVIQDDMFVLAMEYVNRGDVLSMLEYLEPMCGTERVTMLGKRIRRHIAQYEEANNG